MRIRIVVSITFFVLLCSAAAFADNPQTSSDPTLVGQSLAQLNASPKPSADFSFVVMGDNRSNTDVFGWELKRAKRKKPVFMVNTGDLVDQGRSGEYRIFLKQVKTTGLPYFAVPGNHDTDSPAGQANYSKYIGPNYYAFDYQGIRFIFLDNADGSLGTDQLSWFEGQLQGAKKSIVFLHKPPPFEKWAHPYRAEAWSTDADKFTDLVSKYKVPYVFCWHIHRYDRKVVNGTVYIITGGAGGPLDISKRGFYHYVLVTVKNGSITDRMHRLIQ